MIKERLSSRVNIWIKVKADDLLIKTILERRKSLLKNIYYLQTDTNETYKEYLMCNKS
uniref:Uncharacterized protein n=1 Tax=Moniliophthora roreri TaxID=221103 RepID=A0A0W0FLN6_MONRR